MVKNVGSSPMMKTPQPQFQSQTTAMKEGTLLLSLVQFPALDHAGKVPKAILSQRGPAQDHVDGDGGDDELELDQELLLL